MHSVVARDYLAYDLRDLDPALGFDKPHEPRSLTAARAVLEAAAQLPDFPRFLDASSPLCFVARLLRNGGDAATRQEMVNAMFDECSNESVHTVLVRRQVRTLTIAEADALEAEDRQYLIAVERSDTLCDPDTIARTFGKAAIVVRFLARGPNADAVPMLRLEVVDDATMHIHFHEVGVKHATKLVARPIPRSVIRLLQDRTAQPCNNLTFTAYKRHPTAKNAIPDAMTSRLARILQDSLRLHVLVSAASPPDTYRPLAFDRAYVQSDRLMHFQLPFHPSSCRCMCPAHGGKACDAARTTVCFSICGRKFGAHESCPHCKQQEGDDRRMNGCCARHFSIELRCVHRQGEAWRTVQNCVLHHGLSTAARLEVLHVLTILADYFQHRRKPTMERVGSLDNHLLRIRKAPSAGDNDLDALQALVDGSLVQEKLGILKTVEARPFTSAEKRLRETHAHLFPRKRLRGEEAEEVAAPAEAEVPAPPQPEALPPPAAAPAAAPAPAPPEGEEDVLDEYIDCEGLHEAQRQVQEILERASGREQLRAQSFLHFLQQLEDACKADGELVLDGPMGYVCYKMRVAYKQKRNFGRLTTSNARSFDDFYKQEKRLLCLQGCPRLLRPMLCGRFCSDWDLENAQPCLLLQMATRVRNGAHGMPTLQQWVEDRPGFIQHIQEVHDIQDDIKDTCKNLVISLVFGGEYEHWLERRRMPVDIKSPLIVRLARELAALRQTVFTHRDFAGHVQLERARHAKEGDKDPAAADRSIFAIIAQNEENSILSVIRDGVAAQGFQVGSLQFDGAFVIVRPDAELDVAPIERAIYERTGFRMRIVGKPLFFSGEFPKLALEMSASKPSASRASGGSKAVSDGGGALVCDAELARTALEDATDADAVHNQIVAALDESVVAAGVILVQGGGLWLSRQTMPGAAPVLADLGGKKERGETLWDTAVRELREEGGVDLSSTRLVSPEQVFYSSKRTGERSYAFFFVQSQDAPKMTGDKRIIEHCHFKQLPDWSQLHPRMRYATGMRVRLEQCLAER